MIRQRIVVDIDGVLSNIADRIVEKVGTPLNMDRYEVESWYPPDKADLVRIVLEDPDTYKNMEPITGSKKAMRWMDDRGYHIHIVTSRPETTTRITKEWLKKHYRGTYDGIHYVPSDKKAFYVKNQLDPHMSFDDNPDIVAEMGMLGLQAVLFIQPYNMLYAMSHKYGMLVTTSWADIRYALERT